MKGSKGMNKKATDIVAYATLVGFIVAMVAGMVKEIYDLISQKGTPEWRDLVCDLIGIVLGLIIATLWLLIR